MTVVIMNPSEQLAYVGNYQIRPTCPLRTLRRTRECLEGHTYHSAPSLTAFGTSGESPVVEACASFMPRQTRKVEQTQDSEGSDGAEGSSGSESEELFHVGSYLSSILQ